jgi:hypothetical protein
MKTLHNYSDLTDYGVNPLTGEADAYSRRILCDLNQDGLILLTAYLGLAHTKAAEQAFPANMNNTVGALPALASAMLARSVIPDLMIFALLHVDRFDYVFESHGDFVGFNREDTLAVDFYCEREGQPGHLHHNCAKRSTQPHVGDRNVHAMSGRVL